MLDFIALSPFMEMTALLVMAAFIGFIGQLLRQPLIVSFITVGLLAGPSVLDIVHNKEQIELLSELGIAVLLFLVGIKLDVKLIRSIGSVSILTGLGQVIFTSLFGYIIGLALGLSSLESLYVAIALTFSSTIIIVKLLSDKREIDALHGQIALGFLIVQDLVVVLAMIMLATIGIGSSSTGGGQEASIIRVAASGIGLVVFVIIFVRYFADALTELLAKTPELLVIYAIAQAAFFAALGSYVGLGMEVGGLLAGIALASTPYRETIAARLGPLRDFLLLFFFIALGATLDLSQLGNHLTGAFVFSLFILVGNPLIVLIIMGILGYKKRTGFLAGLTVAQISEFSLIFVAMGISLGHVGQDVLGLVTLVGIITIAASTYMITYSHQLYDLFEPVLGFFERKDTPRELSYNTDSASDTYPVIIFGLGRLGTATAQILREKGIDVLGIDFNPTAVKRWKAIELNAEYGDATDAEFINELPVRSAQWIISTIPQHVTGLTSEDARKTLVQIARSTGFTGQIAAMSHNAYDSEELKLAGIDLTLEPYKDAAERTTEIIMEQLAIKMAANKK